MASDNALARAIKRADEAEALLLQLRQKVEFIKSRNVSVCSNSTKEKLINENESLKQEVQELKNTLTKLQIDSGILQVPIPSQRPVVVLEQPKPCGKASEKQVEKAGDAPEAKGNEKNKKAEKQPKKPKEKGGKTAAPTTVEKLDISRLSMRIGKIVDVKKHPDADSLYVETVDFGSETRTIVSGLVKHVPLEQMKNRIAIFMTNLKPAKMRGILSEGMIMCASTPEKVEIIIPPEGVNIGDRVTVDAYPGDADALLNPKKKIWEAIQPDLKIDEQGIASYKGEVWNAAGKGNCKVPTMRNCGIK
ncbi:DgyrCDS10034 [Dimorphilus gyrociliatus]|uniref:DgyrCDS10034 n=1 Tax=Dimorphilus gyrociliatus TaxID=2664684 RepID=A0A7I8W0F2_9ANNE|nr:DgyrCDS10034 [Dimorphilus gyrociliatus]